MTKAEPGGYQRFESAAAALSLEVRTRRFPEGTRTAADAAAAVGCELSQIVKSLVFLCDGDPVLVLTAGSHRVNTARLGEVLGCGVTLADADTARRVTGYDIGGIPPLGHERPLPTVVDDTLLQYERVWAAAGASDAVFEIASGELMRHTGGVVASFAARGS